MSKSGIYRVKTKRYKIFFRYARKVTCFEREVNGTSKQKATRTLRESLGVLGARIVVVEIKEMEKPATVGLVQQGLTNPTGR